jgi:hypothetical protein
MKTVGGHREHVAGHIRSLDDLYAEAKACSASSLSGSCASPLAICGPNVPPAATRHQVPTSSRHPVVDYTPRGDSVGAHAAASSSASRASAMAALEAGMHAASSAGPRRSLLSTWISFHTEWFGVEVEPFPLTEDIVTSVAAMFKSGRYRSFQQYMSRAKEEHIRRGHVWTQVLDWVARQCSRSVTRGIGPARQSAGFSVADVAALDVDLQEVVVDGPLNGQAMLVVASFFMLREAEITAAIIEHLHMDEKKKVMTLTLSVSKTDVKALGVQRAWGCVCMGASGTPCPFCSMTKHLMYLATAFVAPLARDLPLFPTAYGDVPTKAKVVATIEHFMSTLGLPVMGPQGNRIYGGHSCRVAGARYMASLGIDLLTIQLLGRWGSDVVLRYVADVPLSAITRRVVENFKSACIADVAKVDDDIIDARLHLTGIAGEQYEHLKGELQRIKAQLDASSSCSDAKRRFVVNEDSKVVHEPTSCIGPTGSWSTRCGWAFARAKAAVLRPDPDPTWPRCATCFRLPEAGSEDA